MPELRGASLVTASAKNLHKRQVFEIENGSLSVVEHHTATKICPACGTISKAQFPPAVKAPVQYGISFLSRALYLHLYQLLPVARTQEAMRDLFGCSISQALIQRATPGVAPLNSSDASSASRRAFGIRR